MDNTEKSFDFGEYLVILKHPFTKDPEFGQSITFIKNTIENEQRKQNRLELFCYCKIDHELDGGRISITIHEGRSGSSITFNRYSPYGLKCIFDQIAMCFQTYFVFDKLGEFQPEPSDINYDTILHEGEGVHPKLIEFSDRNAAILHEQACLLGLNDEQWAEVMELLNSLNLFGSRERDGDEVFETKMKLMAAQNTLTRELMMDDVSVEQICYCMKRIIDNVKIINKETDGTKSK